MDTQPQWTPPPGAGAGPPGWSPPRRRSRVRLVTGIVLALVLVVAVAGLSGLRLWPSFPNPFATRQVDRSQPVLLKAIEDLEVYKAATGNFQVVVDLEESSRGIPLVIKGQRTLFVAGGSVDADAFDVSLMLESIFKPKDNSESEESGFIRFLYFGENPNARKAHLELADRYDDLATAIAARERQLGLHVVDVA